MAVVDEYINTEILAGKKANAGENAGVLTWEATGTFETVAADDNASIKRIIKGIPWNMVLSELQFYTDGITGATDWDIGIYETSQGGIDGPVIDKDVLADGLDFSSAVGRTNFLDGLATVNIADINKPLYLLAGETLLDHKLNYDIAITMNVAGSGVATVSWLARTKQG